MNSNGKTDRAHFQILHLPLSFLQLDWFKPKQLGRRCHIYVDKQRSAFDVINGPSA